MVMEMMYACTHTLAFVSFEGISPGKVFFAFFFCLGPSMAFGTFL